MPFSVQGGTDADVLFADAVAKGLGGFDNALAYEAVRKDATTPATEKIFSSHGRFAPYFTLGYVPALTAGGKTADGRENEYAHAVSGTLEYAYNDYAVSAVAKAVGEQADALRFQQRSEENAFRLFDPDTKFFWGKDAAGQWLPGFDPEAKPYAGWLPIFYEGSAWQYRFSVPQDIQGLMDRLGGPEKFSAILDEYFDGGHHDQGNEPGFLTPWLYTYAGRPGETVDRVRHILQKDFQARPGRLPWGRRCGGDVFLVRLRGDGVLSQRRSGCLPSRQPVFPQVRLRLADGKTFTIKANRLSEQNRYVQSARLNGRLWDKAWFRHGDIIGGATLTLEMGPRPSPWGTQIPPPSLSAPEDKTSRRGRQ